MAIDRRRPKSWAAADHASPRAPQTSLCRDRPTAGNTLALIATTRARCNLSSESQLVNSSQVPIGRVVGLAGMAGRRGFHITVDEFWRRLARPGVRATALLCDRVGGLCVYPFLRKISGRLTYWCNPKFSPLQLYQRHVQGGNQPGCGLLAPNLARWSADLISATHSILLDQDNTSCLRQPQKNNCCSS